MHELDIYSISSTQKRVGSFVIDDIVIALLILVIFYNQLAEIVSHLPNLITVESIEIFKQEMNQFSVDNLLPIIALKITYHTFLVWYNGMTLGKYFMKIRVEDIATGQTLTFPKSLLRASLRMLSEVFFYLGFIMAWFMPLKQTFHDKLSQSMVVKNA